jgi:exoribonuclease R
LPEININTKNLLQYSTLIGTNKRAITFNFKIDIENNKVDFIIKNTILTNILNTTYNQYDDMINCDLKHKKKLIALCNFMKTHLNCYIDFNEINLESNISHKMIELFMIWTNYYVGNYLYNIKNKMIVRTQNNFIELQKAPEYTKTFFNVGAKYEIIDGKNEDHEYIHATLGIKNYCHVTSPMRRFIDMFNHLLIHNIDNDKKIYDRLVELISINQINSKLKNYKKLMNAYDTILHLKINNKFTACVFDILKNNKALFIIKDILSDFKKIIKIEVPLEFHDKLYIFEEFNIELFYDPYKFKSKTIPFSIKII